MTTKQQYTPGQWFIGSLEDGLVQILSGDASYPINGAAPLDVVCLVKKKANARLIAAAPELLHALRALLAHRGTEQECYAIEYAKEAIAKAEGK